MTKLGGNFGRSEEVALEVEELLAALGAAGCQERMGRRQAIACFLSGGDGWRESKRALDGAFSALPDVHSARAGGGEQAVNQPISESLQRTALKSGTPRQS